jgi:dTDP-4-amino-4,6-dideoxygalactose transaminase
MIPMVDLKQQYRELETELLPALKEALAACQYILGPNVSAFEQEAAAYLGVKHAVACASGTDALYLALLAAGIKPGDEVITTPFTFIATAEAIRYVGAVPRFVDIDAETFNISPDAVSEAINGRTRAIIPVHLFGQPADMLSISAIARSKGLLLVEDCAQSFGAAIAGKMTGAFGGFGCFSFFPSKNLGCYGDGGMVVTDSGEHAERLRMYRNHGSRERYHHDVIGLNSRLDELQAIILRAKLKRIDAYNTGRQAAAQRYNELLTHPDIKTPAADGIGKHVYHQYTILLPDAETRKQVMQALSAKKIASAIYYPVPLHRQNVFRNDYAGLSLPVAESVAERCLSLPIYPELTGPQIDAVVETIFSALEIQ